MDTRRRRSPLRILAPVALIAFGVALAMIISSANNSGSGSGTSSTAAEKARDLGTSKTTARQRRRSASRDRLPKSIYIVKAGDTLGSIAQKVGVSVTKLQALNPGLDQFSLQSGQKLRIR
jgi:teichoic acid transport system ATP-binding protein